MAKKTHKSDAIVAKLHQVDVLHSRGMSMAEAIRQIGVTEVTFYQWCKYLIADALWRPCGQPPAMHRQ